MLFILLGYTEFFLETLQIFKLLIKRKFKVHYCLCYTCNTYMYTQKINNTNIVHDQCTHKFYCLQRNGYDLFNWHIPIWLKIWKVIIIPKKFYSASKLQRTYLLDALEAQSHETKFIRVLWSTIYCFFWVNSKYCDHVKSGYIFSSSFPKIFLGALRILSPFGHKKNASVFLSISLLVITLWLQLLYIPLVNT